MSQNAEIHTSVFGFLTKHVGERPESVCIVFGEERFTYREVYAQVVSIGSQIESSTNDQSVVLLRFSDQAKLFFAMLACIRLGRSIVLCPPLPFPLLSKYLGDVQIDIGLTMTDSNDIPGSVDVELDKNQQQCAVNYQPVDCSVASEFSIYFFTSGTTGKSKFVPVGERDILKAIKCILETRFMPYLFFQNAFVSSPIFHSLGFSTTFEYLAAGSTLHVCRYCDMLSQVKFLCNHGLTSTITVVEGVPYFFQQILAVMNRINLPNLKHIGLGGDLVDNKLLEKLSTFFPFVEFSIRYGVTELPSVIALRIFKLVNLNNPRVIGNLLPIYECDLLSADGSKRSGELVVKISEPPERLIHTGDIFEIIDGHFIFLHRKNLIKNRGFSVNPVEVETCVLAHDKVLDAKVYSKDNRLICEIVTMENAAVDSSGIRVQLTAKLPKYAVPDYFLTVNEIERTFSGKIRRV